MAEYLSPGAYAEEIQNTIAPSPIANERMVAILSEVEPSRPNREILTLTGLDGVELTKQGAEASSVRVFSRDLLVEYTVTDHFSVSQIDANTPQALTDLSRLDKSVTNEVFTLDSGTSSYKLDNPVGVHDIQVSTGDVTPVVYEMYTDYTFDKRRGTIVALDGGTLPRDGSNINVSYKYGIESGETVIVEYRYADEEYYKPKLFIDYTDVRRVFGEPFDSEGNVNEMSFAAQMVFANGSSQTEVLAIPVSPYSTGTAGTVTLADWQVAIEALDESEFKPSMLLETSGNVDVQSFLISFVQDTSYYRRTYMAFLGRDGSQSAMSNVELRDYAKAVNHERVVILSDPVWETLNSVGGGVIRVGGQYGAAALAGLITRILVQETATRRSLSGIRTPGGVSNMEMDRNTTSGICQVENNQGFMTVRHATTTAYGNINTREINVIRQKDFVIRSLRETLDSTVIGKLMQPNIEEITANTATNILEQMVGSYIIAEYGSPQVFQNASDPTRLDLRFEYLPNYAVNTVFIQFSLSELGTIGTALNAGDNV